MKSTQTRQRLDLVLVERRLTDTRSRARALIMAGDVLVDGAVEARAGALIGPSEKIEFRTRPRFVGRGGEKLNHALDAFDIVITGLVCADFGASTGGFTDCLLQRGAARCYAIDVGYGQLHESLRNDPRVVTIERTNARFLDQLPEPIDLVTIDVSFISLGMVLPAAKRLLRSHGLCVSLIKPQFEAGRSDVKKGGVVRDPLVHARVLREVVEDASESGFALHGLTRSPLVGPAGNVEFLAMFARHQRLLDVEAAIREVIYGPDVPSV